MDLALVDVIEVVGWALGSWAIGWCLGALHRTLERFGEVLV